MLLACLRAYVQSPQKQRFAYLFQVVLMLTTFANLCAQLGFGHM